MADLFGDLPTGGGLGLFGDLPRDSLPNSPLASNANSGSPLIQGKSSEPLPMSPLLANKDMVAPGNVELWNRPAYLHPDYDKTGDYGTTESFSRDDNGVEVLVPQIINGKRLTQDQAWAHYKATGENLGKFKSPDAADAYAESLHDAQDKYVMANGGPKAFPAQGLFDDLPKTSTWSDIGTGILNSFIPGLQKTVGGIEQRGGENLEQNPTPDDAQMAGAFQWLLNPQQAASREAQTQAGGFAAGRRGAEQYAAGEAAQNATAPQGVEWYDPKNIAYQAGSGLLASAPALAATAITKSPAVAAGAFALPAGADAYAAARKNGRTPEQAAQDASVSAILNGGAALVPIGLLMKSGAPVLQRALASAAGMGATSATAEALQTAYDKGVIGDNITLGDALKRISQAGIVGTVTGGAFGLLPHGGGEEEAEPEPEKIEPTVTPPPGGNGGPPGGPPGAGSAPVVPPAPTPNIDIGDYAASAGQGLSPDDEGGPPGGEGGADEDTNHTESFLNGEASPQGNPPGIPDDTLANAKRDVADLHAPPPKDVTLLSAIKTLGGIKIADANGAKTKEGQDVAEALKDRKIPGVINNKSGLTPDYMREALQQHGWFGDAEGAGTDIQDLYDLIGKQAQGDTVFHPNSPAQAILDRRSQIDEELSHAGVEGTDTPAQMAQKLALFRHNQDMLEPLRNHAEDLGVPHADKMGYDELLAEVAERQAMRAENDHSFDDIENASDAFLAANHPEYLADLHSRSQADAERGAVEGPEGLAPGWDSEPEASANAEEPDQGANVSGEGPAPSTEDVDLGGKTVQQTVIPGAERSQRQEIAALQARREGRGKILPTKAQKGAGGMFAAPEAPEASDVDLFTGEKTKKPLFRTSEATHGKTGEKLFVASLGKDVGEDNFKRIHNLAKMHDGYYSPRKGDTPPSFKFKTAKDRSDFMSVAEPFDQIPSFQRAAKEGEPKPTFYSALTRGIESTKMSKAPAKDWAGLIDNLPGVKKEEIEWSGIKDWLKSQDKAVTRDDVLNFLRANDIQIEEVAKGDSPEVARLRQEWEDTRTAMSEAGPLEMERLTQRRNALAARLSHLQQNHDDVTKYGTYTLPGGENYRELLMTLPTDGTAVKTIRAMNLKLMDKYGDLSTAFRNMSPEERNEYDRLSGEAVKEGDRANYQSSHWEEPNVLAHIRFDDRTGPNGEKILHVAEVQSDWHQQGRRDGYLTNARTLASARADANAIVKEKVGPNAAFVRANLRTRDGINIDGVSPADVSHWVENGIMTAADGAKIERYIDLVKPSGVPDAPFKTTWQELAMKRMLRYAVEHGYDKITWDTGETNAKRYDLSKHIDHLTYEPDQQKLRGFMRGEPILRKRATPEELPDIVGKDVADKLLSTDRDIDTKNAHRFPETSHELVHSLSGVDLKVGGEGMKGFYDRILPQFMNKYLKKWGASVTDGRLPNDGFASGRDVVLSEYPDATTADVNRIWRGWTPEEREEHMEAYRKSGEAVHGVDVTDKMRDSVMEGQPLFKREEAGGAEEPAGEGVRVARGLRGTPMTDENLEKFAPVLQNIVRQLKRLAPGADLDPYKAMHATDETGNAGEVYGASFQEPTPQGIRQVIALAMNANDLVHTIGHEAIHALKQMGAFSPTEWAGLRQAAIDGDWLNTYNIGRDYPELPYESQIEEAIAERFADWRANKALWLPKSIRPIFIELEALLRKFAATIRRAFGGNLSADDIFTNVEAGNVGWRNPGDAGVVPSFARGNRGNRNQGAPAPGQTPQQTRSIAQRYNDIMRQADRIIGTGAHAIGRAISDTMDKYLPESVNDLAREIQLRTGPMAAGTDRARVAAKEFANAIREVRYRWGKYDDWLVKNFDASQRKAMWEAADEHSVLEQQGKTVGPSEGLNRLTPEERAAVDQMQKTGAKVFALAQKLKMTNSPGLPSYAPRMLIEMTSGGAKRVGSSGMAQTGDTGRNLNTTTGNLKNRKYLETAETEKAGRAKFGANTEVVKDIRTLAHAIGKLEQAIAGRTLMDRIRQIGKQIGVTTVAAGGTPNPHDYFTISDHPAFREWGPDFTKDPTTGKMVPRVDQNGQPVWKGTPLYVSKEFEGPLRAVLSRTPGKIYSNLMDLKGRMMSSIMFSPLMHNAVVWGKAAAGDPLKVLSFQIYGIGQGAMQDAALMRDALSDGLDLVGRRFGFQDITSIADQAAGFASKPRSSWTAELIAAIPGLFDKGLSDAIKQKIADFGDVWHNKFLWDKVAQLQVGLYKTIRDHAMSQGLDKDSAGKFAAHFANRYAGSIPMEAMSRGARATANLLMFSRSFTMTNLGSFKDLVTGLPRDIQAQILAKAGQARLNQVQGMTRRKMAATLAIDLGLRHFGLLLGAGAAYALRSYFTSHPSPYQDPSQNEPGKENRFFIGYDKDGTGLYGRMPTGKYPEEAIGWATQPLEETKAKLSPYARLAYELAANDKGFGQKMYDPTDLTPSGWAQTMESIIGEVFNSVAPTSMLESGYDLATGQGDTTTNALKATMPWAGITISKGAPGGPAVGEMYAARTSHDFQVEQALPGIKDKIRNGDVAGARADMRALGVPIGLQNYYVRVTKNPALRLSPRAQRDFRTYATPDQKAQMRDALGRRQTTPAP